VDGKITVRYMTKNKIDKKRSDRGAARKDMCVCKCARWK